MDDWIKLPNARAAVQWDTVPGCKSVLAPIAHIPAGSTLKLMLPLIERDRDLHVVFTIPPSRHNWYGLPQYVRSLGGIVAPWSQVTQTRFDLALTASFSGIHELDAQIGVFPHGVRMMKSRRGPWGNDVDMGQGLGQQVLARDGRIVPNALFLAHDDEAEVLRDQLPQALARATVAGDLRYDQQIASAGRGDHYRHALGARDDEVLVLITSTWGTSSLFRSEGDLFARVADELDPTEFRVVTVLHPTIWSLYGKRTVLSWLGDYLDAGHGILPQEQGWEAASAVAEVAIGDNGSVTQYAAANGAAILMSVASGQDEYPESVSAFVRSLARPLEAHPRLDHQIRAALQGRSPDFHAAVAGRITSRPGQAAAIIRREVYSLLELPEPASEPRVLHAPTPRLIRWPPTWLA